jgi:hypothetical protein
LFRHGRPRHTLDFETLTIDLLLTTDGLSVIDAALVAAPGPSYEPFPSEQDRHTVAVAVLQSLGIDPTNANINAAMSDRYHEVGFTVRFATPYTNAGRAEFRLDTGQLQRIVAERHLKQLKVAACDADGDRFTATGSRVPSPFAVQASATAPGRDPDVASARAERLGCIVWALEPTGAPVSIRARVVARTLASTGGGITPIGAAAILIGVGLALCLATKRRRSPFFV